MKRMLGSGLGSGKALGMAAVVRMRSGIPMLPPIPVQIAAQLAIGAVIDLPDLIVVSPEYDTALALIEHLNWGHVTGIVCEEQPVEPIITNYPTVTGIEGLLNSVSGDTLLLVDADHGLLLIDPDSTAVAHYQARQDQIAPRHRIYLGEAHLSAQTLDGRTITVFSRIVAWEDLETALDIGTDGLMLPDNTFILPKGADVTFTRHSLTALMDRAAGKAIVLTYHPDLELLPVMESAAKGSVALVIHPDWEAPELGLDSLKAQLNELQTELLEGDEDWSLPLLTAELSVEKLPDPGRIEELAAHGISRIILSSQDVETGFTNWHSIIDTVAAATACLIPTMADVSIQSASESEILPGRLIGCGFSGLLTTPEETAGWKEAIRYLSSSEWRELLLTERMEGDDIV